MDAITQIFPQPVHETPLKGAYLAHDLRQNALKTGKPFVYSNFVVSLDGRIAVEDPKKGLTVPKATANDRDWRLFQELAAQADMIISSGRYLRDWAEGKAQEILQVDDPRFADLRDWRKQRGLSEQADIAVVSRSLDFPIPDVLSKGGRKAVVFTTADADSKRKKALEEQGVPVVVAGKRSVEGAELVLQMSKLGYKTVYSGAGPQIMHLLVKDHTLNRLYLTHANRLLGGEHFSSIVEGPRFDPPANAKLHTMYLDAEALDGLGQLFVSYNVV